MWDSASLAAELSEREAGWWDARLRNDAAWRAAVLAEDFIEIAPSGAVRRRHDLLVTSPEELAVEVLAPVMRRLAARVALVSYVTRERGGASQYRGSLWIQHDDGWRLHVHQAAVAEVAPAMGAVLHAVA